MRLLSIAKTGPAIETLVWTADLAGTFAFAVEGAVTGMRGDPGVSCSSSSDPR
jgi:hypothetical protein